jgi:hypothetical protein
MLTRLIASATLAVAAGAATLTFAEDGGRLRGRLFNRGAEKRPAAPDRENAKPEQSRLGGGSNWVNAFNRAPGFAKDSGNRAENARSANVGGSVLKDQGSRHQKQLDLEQRNLEHRLAQAQKLRQKAEQNGDAELSSKADRMEADAIKHYEDRVEHLVGRLGTEDPTLAPPVVEGPTVTSPIGDAPVGTDAPSLELNPSSVDVKIDVPEPPATGNASSDAARPWWKPKFLEKR